MKKLIFTLAAVIAASTSIDAVAQSRNVKPVDDLRVYINPGHGGWGTNDRPAAVYYEKPDGTIGTHTPGTSSSASTTNPVYPDTLAFYESNTNLWKCLAVVDYLEAAGFKFDRTLNANNTTKGQEGPGRCMENNIVMSRTKNGPYPCTGNPGADGKPESDSQYNRNLSEICMEVNSNHFDLFLAVHSNGGNSDQENYILFLYRGYDDATTTISSGLTKSHQQISRQFALLLDKYTHSLPYQKWTSHINDPYVKGDIDFYGGYNTVNGATGYLGALKSKTPGVLTEGYFHTYEPSRHRAMNPDVDRIEGLRYTRGILEFFGLPFSGKGNIYGIVRANGVTFTAAYYTPNQSTNDKYRPINGATVRLKQNGTLLKTYTTDNYFNGAFCFFDLNPGTYTIEVSAPGYRSYTQDVVVKANQESLPEVFLNAEGSGSTVSNPLYDPAELAGVEAPSSFTLTRNYTDQEISELAQCASIRRVLAHGDYLYILGLKSNNTPVLVKYDHVNRTSTLLSTSGCTGTYLALSDIAMTTDGYLVGINSGQQDSSSDQGTHTSAETYIYKWANGSDGTPTTAAPIIWLSSNTSASFFKAKTGQTMAYAGSTSSGYIYYTAHNDYYSTSDNVRVVRLAVANNALSGTSYDRLSDLKHPTTSTDSYYTTTRFGEMRLDASPVSGRYLLSGPNHQTVEFSFPSTANNAPTEGATMSSAVPTSVKQQGVFAYGGKNYLITPAEGSTSGKTDGIDLIDITSGVASASTVTTTNNRSTLSSSTYDMATAAAVGTTMESTSGQTATFQMVLFELRGGNRLTKLTAPSVSTIITEQFDHGATLVPGDGITPTYAPKATRTPMAYGLRAAGSASYGYTLTFSLTEDAKKAEIVVTGVPAEGAGESDTRVVATLLNPEQGAHNVEIETSALRAGYNYNWSVRVTGNPTIEGKVFQHNHPDVVTVDGGGVAVINDPEAEHFGWIGYSNNHNGGLMFFNPELQPMREQPFPYVNPTDAFYKVALNSAEVSGSTAMKYLRMAVDGDDFYVCDYNDPSSNLWRITPATYTQAENPADFISIYPSTATKTTAGKWTNSGVAIGSGCSAFAFTGSGADRKLWMFAEDYPTANVLVYHNIGEAKINNVTYTIPNSQVKKGSLITRSSVSLSPWENGVWVGLNTGNTSAKPAFIYMLADGTITYNSYTSSAQLNSLCENEGAVAINHDGSLLAIGVPNEGIRVYNVSWNGNTPTLSYRQTIAESNNFDGTSQAMSASTYTGVQLAWDYANNVYAFQVNHAAINAGLNVYSLGENEPVATTPAPKASLLRGADEQHTPQQPTTERGVFAYNLRLSEATVDDEKVYTLSYDLTGDVSAASVKIADSATNTVVMSIEAAATAGHHEVSVGESELIDAAMDAGMPMAGTCVWSLDYTTYMVGETKCVERLVVAADQVSSGGVCQMKDTDSAFYGYFGVAEGFGKGLSLYTPDFGSVQSYPNPQNAHWDASKRYSPLRLYEHNGSFYLTDWSDAGSDIYIWSLEQPSKLSSAYDKSRLTFSSSNGTYKLGSTIVGGSSTSVAFTADGTHKYMWAFMEDVPNDTDLRGVLCRYDITDGGLVASAPTIFPELSVTGRMSNTDVEMIPTHGGMFLSQKKTSAMTHTSLVYITADGTVKFDSKVDGFDDADTQIPTCGRGIALNDEENILAVSLSGGKIRLFDLSWNGDTPVLTFREEIVNDAVSATYEEMSQMGFDVAGNLYAWTTHYNSSKLGSSGASGLYIYAIEREGRQMSVSAPSNQLLSYEYREEEPEWTDRFGVYAYDLRYEGDRKNGYNLHFKLNGPAEKVTIRLREYFTGKYYDEEPGGCVWETPGLYGVENSVFIDPSNIDKSKAYLWEVVVHNHPVAQTSLLINKDPLEYDTAGGVLVVRDINSPYNGHIVTSTGRGIGFRSYTPQFAEIVGGEEKSMLVEDNILYPKHSSWNHPSMSTLRYAPSRLAENQGKVIAASWNYQVAGLFSFRPGSDDPIETYYKPGATLAINNTAKTGLWMDGSVQLGGSVTGIAFTGKGADAKLWAVDENAKDGGVSYPYSLVRYDIGKKDYIDAPPTVYAKINPQLQGSGLLRNGDVSIAPAHGGLFLGQIRATGHNDVDIPSFIYINYDGDVLYNSGESLPYTHSDAHEASQAAYDTTNNVMNLKASGSAIAVNDAETLLAVSEGRHGIKVFDLAWAPNGAPILSNMRRLPLGVEGLTMYYWSTAIRTPQMCFDPAGNLYVYFFQNVSESPQRYDAESGIHVYAIKTHDNSGVSASHAPAKVQTTSPTFTTSIPGGFTVQTKAPESQVIRGNDFTTDLELIGVQPGDDAETIYYDLQGRRVAPERLTGGVYMRVRGGVAEKIVIGR